MKTTVAYCFWDTQGHLSQTAPRGNFLDNTHFLDLIHFSVSLLHSQATAPGITFQINTLCANSYLRVHFWRNQMKSPFLRILGFFFFFGHCFTAKKFNSFTPRRGHWIREIKYYNSQGNTEEFIWVYSSTPFSSPIAFLEFHVPHICSFLSSHHGHTTLVKNHNHVTGTAFQFCLCIWSVF